MLARINRLSLRHERTRLQKDGVSRHSQLFTVVTAPATTPSKDSRFAVLISKKLAPLSVTRHRLKRQITEVIRHNLSKFPPGHDFLIIPKKTALAATEADILAILIKQCS